MGLTITDIQWAYLDLSGNLLPSTATCGIPVLLAKINGRPVIVDWEQKLLRIGFDVVTLMGNDELSVTIPGDPADGRAETTAHGASDDDGLVGIVKEFLAACADRSFRPCSF